MVTHRLNSARPAGHQWLALAAALWGLVAGPPQAGAEAGEAGSTAASAPQIEWHGIDRVVAFADVHGAYAELTALLESQGIIDQHLSWAAGRTHLVSMGDLLDRGDDSRKVMDLLIRLQQEAPKAGGQVHVVVGNHEAMNVLGDLRYVSRGDYAAYAADEDPGDRKAQEAAFLERNPGSSEADFERLFPPGYFGHRRLLRPDGTYGKWILAQPAIIVINDTVYMHGGPSLVLGTRSIAELDRDYAAALDEYLGAESALQHADLIESEDPYSRRASLAQTRLGALPEDRRATLAPAVARFAAADESPLLGAEGPNWYRGSALCNECAEADVLRPFLQRTGMRRVVIGHTVARNGTVVSRFDGAVIKLDAGMNKAFYQGRPAALISDTSGARVAYANPTTAAVPVPAEPIYLSSPTIDEQSVEAILADGSVEPLETCGPGILRVRVTKDSRSVDAIFEQASAEQVGRELAAWKLDNLLRLGLVPATVPRSYQGTDGVLQGRPPSWASEQDRQNINSGAPAGLACQAFANAPKESPVRRPVAAGAVPPRFAGGYCDINAQYQLAYAFDALIGNQGRTLDRYLYDLDPSMHSRGLALVLTGHGSAFGTQTRLPSAMETALARTGPEMQSRLRRLTTADVTQAIGKWVSDREVKALLERRDRILALAQPASGH